MRKIGLWASAAAAAAVIGASFVAAAAARPSFECTSTRPSGVYQSIVVPAGATCDGTEARIVVVGGVTVGAGATFILGQDGGGSTGTVNGGVSADGAASVQIHFAHINGGVSVQGGSGFFSTIEDNLINGGATIDGYSGFWLGFIRNSVNGTVTISNNSLQDPDAIEVVTNRINGDLVCRGNAPNPPKVGDSEGSPNAVRGQKVDQCDVPGL